jgi:hypothetical protein
MWAKCGCGGLMDVAAGHRPALRWEGRWKVSDALGYPESCDEEVLPHGQYSSRTVQRMRVATASRSLFLKMV